MLGEDRDEEGEDRERASGVVGMGAACLDYLASVTEYPKPDDKIRSTAFKTEGGGNCGNSLVAISRLLSSQSSLMPALESKVKMVTKVGLDSVGEATLSLVEEEGVDVSSCFRGGETSAFTYILVDEKDKTRTCIHTPLAEQMTEDEIQAIRDNANDILGGVSVVVFDGRHTEGALALAQIARERKITILVDAEKPRPLLKDLLQLADVVVAPESFLSSGTSDTSILSQAIDFARDCLPRAKLLCVTRGKRGSITLAPAQLGTPVNNDTGGMDEKDGEEENRGGAERDPLSLFVRGEAWFDSGEVVLVPFTRPLGGGDGSSAFETSSCAIPDELVVDTTGAGDAFIGALAFAIACPSIFSKAPLGGVIGLASIVAAIKLQKFGARSGLVHGRNLALEDLLQIK